MDDHLLSTIAILSDLFAKCMKIPTMVGSLGEREYGILRNFLNMEKLEFSRICAEPWGAENCNENNILVCSF